MRAAHGLYRLARSSGDVGKAAQFALAAYRAFRPDSVEGPELLLELARFWNELDESNRATAVLRVLFRLRSFLSAADQLSAAALTARAFAARESTFSATAAADAWPRLDDEGIPQDVRFRAALDLAHAARSAGDLAAFTRAKRHVLRLASDEAFRDASMEVAELWPEGQPALKMERAS